MRFKSLNNRKDTKGLELLSSAKNIDIDDENQIRRRKGGTQIYTGASVHSLWGDENRAYFVDGTTLHRLFADDTTEAVGTVSGKPLSYTAVGHRIYISDGITNQVIDESALRQWGVSVPESSPTALSTPGDMEVRVIVTNVAEDGRESGASPATTVSTDGGRIAVTIVGEQRVYATMPGGEEYFRTAPTFFANNARTSTAPHRFLDVPPNGVENSFYYNGRIYLIIGDTIFYSEAYDYERFDLAYNFIRFNAPVTMAGAVDTGIYVADGSIHYLSGRTPQEFVRTTVADYNAVRGTMDTHGSSIVFTTDRGVCIAGNDGEFKNITYENVSFKFGDRATGMVRHQDGMVHFVTFFDEGGNENIFTPPVGVMQIRRR